MEIDGQRMVFENGVQQWVNFIWPNKGAIPGARITAIDLEGKTHTIVDEPGEYGINRLIEGATRTQSGNTFEMLWRSKEDPKLFVKMNFRLISGSGTAGIGSNQGYNGMILADKVVTSKAVRVVAAQTINTTQAPVVASAPSPVPQGQTGSAP